MGAGKSFLSKYMTQQYNWKVVDLDDYIIEKEGATITELMAISEEHFRVLESKYLAELASLDFDLVSLGGGTPCSEENWKVISQNYTSIYLKWSGQTLFNRLKDNKLDRPLIAKLEDPDLIYFIDKSLAERAKYYERADIIFDGDQQKIEELLAILSDYAIRKR